MGLDIFLRRSGRRALTLARSHVALLQFAGALLCLPALVFSGHVPAWAPKASVLGLLLLLLVGRLLAGRAFVRTPLDVPLLFSLLLLPVTRLVTADPSLTLPHVYKVIGGAALFYGVVGLLEEEGWYGPSALLISLGALGLAGLALLGTRWLTHKFPWLPFDVYRYLPRALQPFWNPEGFHSNNAGAILAMLLPVPLAYVYLGRRRAVRLGAAFVAGSVGLVLLVTQSRGAIGALLVGLAVMMAVRDRRWLIVALLLVVAGILALGYGETTDAAELATSAELAAQTMQGRLRMWSVGMEVLRDFPFTGVGFGTLVRVAPLLYPSSAGFYSTGWQMEHVHNLYLQSGVDRGFPGLIVTLALLMGLLYVTWRAARRARGTELAPLASATLGLVVVYAVHGLTDNPTFYKPHFVAWALFGVAVAVGMRVLRPVASPGAAPPSEPS